MLGADVGALVGVCVGALVSVSAAPLSFTVCVTYDGRSQKVVGAVVGEAVGVLQMPHFFCMAAIVGFLVVHVALALLVPKSLRAMIIGK